MMIASTRKPCLTHVPLFVLTIACQFALSRAGTPAVIWCPHNESADYDSTFKSQIRSNPLQKLSSEDFEESLSRMNITNPTVILAEELCVEDLKNNKVLSIATNGTKIHYFPHVVMSHIIFRKIFNEIQVKTIEDINDDHELNMVLKDNDSNKCVALTGKQCRYSQTERIKREATAENSTEFKIKTDRILFYSSQAPSFRTEVPGKPEKAVELPGSKVTEALSKDLNGTLVLKIKFSDIEDIGNMVLEFFFSVKNVGYYTWDKVRYELNERETDVLFAKRDIYFPHKFSYHCSLETIFVNDTTCLNITEMQVEIDHRNATFSDAYDCVGFTSIPIWTGIFVTAILGLIMIWALTMIMDIRTMDRFDDPKGKTITISTAE